MTLLTMRASLRLRLGVPTNDAMFPDATCTELLNNGMHKIDTDHDWPWLEASETITPASGTAVYTPHASWLRTLEVQWGDYPPLERMDIAKLRAMGTPAGRPAFYAVYAEQLTLRPVPNATSPTITHLYTKMTTAMSADADVPLMPVPYQWVIVEYAAYLGFRRIGKLDEAGGAQAAYVDWRDNWIKEHPSRYTADQGGGDVPAPIVPVAR